MGRSSRRSRLLLVCCSEADEAEPPRSQPAFQDVEQILHASSSLPCVPSCLPLTLSASPTPSTKSLRVCKGGGHGAAGCDLVPVDLESCAASKPSASPPSLPLLLGSLAPHSQGFSCCSFPPPPSGSINRLNLSPHTTLPTSTIGAAPTSSFPSMKFLTFATVVGTASAFLAPAPMHTRTQGRVSTLSFLQILCLVKYI